MAEARKRYQETNEDVRVFGEFMYKADTWDRLRRVVMCVFRRIRSLIPAIPITLGAERRWNLVC